MARLIFCLIASLLASQAFALQLSADLDSARPVFAPASASATMQFRTADLIDGDDDLAMAELQLLFSEQLDSDAFDAIDPGTEALDNASGMIGVRYRYGSASENATDCSGLVRMAFRNAGVDLPRSTRDLIHAGREVGLHALQPGDLLFYRFRKNQLHVAIYAGNREIIHASPDARRVVRTRLSSHWDRRLVKARRVLPSTATAY